MRTISAVVLVALLGASACSEEAFPASGEASNAYEIKNGRLIFSTPEDAVSTINQLNLLSNEELTQWARSQPSFTSLYLTEASSTPSAEAPLELSDGVKAIMNRDAVYQIGESIYYLRGDTEFEIENETLLAQMTGGGLVAVAEGVTTRKVNITILKQSEPTIALLSAPYQKEYSLGGHTYKFVFEAYAGAMGFGLFMGVRSKFEYRKGSSWPAAGQTVYKTIKNLRFTISTDSGPANVHNFPDKTQNDNRNAVQEVAYTFTNCLFADLVGDFSSVWVNYSSYEVINAGFVRGPGATSPARPWDDLVYCP